MQATGKKIFISDDDTDILSILGMMLKTKGYVIESSTNAHDVFKYKTNLPDLILLDLWMSGIDGRTIYKSLKEDEQLKHVPVIFISANSKLKEISEEFQVDDYLSKPFEMEELLGKVKRLISAPN